MIQLACAKCKKVLEVDDGFAGGVCRCQFCGAIQTVPAPGGRPARPASPVIADAAPVAAPATGTSVRGSGLDDLADAVAASSGLSRKGLASKSGPAAQNPGGGSGASAITEALNPEANPVLPANRAARKRLMLLGVAIAVPVVVLIAVIGFVALRSGPAPAGPGTDPANTNTPDASNPPAVTSGPNLAGIPLAGNAVVYLIDDGGSNAPFFEAVKDAVISSAKTLKSNSKYAIIFWSDPGKSTPASGLQPATGANHAKAAAAIAGKTAVGSTTIDEGIRSALRRGPTDVVIVTAKGSAADEELAAIVRSARGSAAVRIHVLSLNRTEKNSPLRKIASSTGGVYREPRAEELR